MSEGRLKSLRMVGFKSFAERTVVEFGPGISCVIGPNGSGKSNLADALRWALGEQGRSLRTRRAEDLIFAGSSSRRAIGMADVTLVIDNQDRLLPVDYAEIELGRRLFRSGENEYLLNRQKIRLRDLVDLLDEANLADNAFLFIGQGMVDQALALRPEERRPLFEEAAGIRKHERRRRTAEAELAEAEANVERVRDVLAELRPQARRLAAQAEQQEQRRSAGSELAEALVAFGRARLIGAEGEADRHRGTTAQARTEADVALALLRDAEEEAHLLTVGLAERADAERELRTTLDAARAVTLEQRLAEARHGSETQAVARERTRLEQERLSLEGRIADARRAASVPLPEVDAAAEIALRDAERALAAAIAELDGVRAGTAVEAERHARWLAAQRSQQEDLARARQRHAELARRAADAERDESAASGRLATVHAGATAAADAARAAAAEEERTEAAAEEARGAAASAEALLADVSARHASAVGELNGIDARIAAIQALLDAAVDQEAYRAAKRRGGQLVAEGLDVDAGLRTAVEAALGEALRGLAVDADAALALRDRRATLLLPEVPGRAGRGQDRDAARLEAGVAAAGGGALAAAIRRDPAGHVTRLLARAFWVPNLEAALSLRAQLAPGWRLVTRAGELVTDEGLVRVGPAASQLERQAELRSFHADRARVADEVGGLERARTSAETSRGTSLRALHEARAALEAARRSRRVAEEQERSTGRADEAAARDGAWQSAVLERLREQVASAAADLARLEEARPAAAEAVGPATVTGTGAAGLSPSPMPDWERDVAALQANVAALQAARDERASELDALTRRNLAADEARRRAEIAASMDERRLADLEAEAGRLVGTESDLAAIRERVSTALAAAVAVEGDLGRRLAAILDAGRDERVRLATAEAAAAAARERLRGAEARGRTAEVAEMEARLHVDAARESLLVELAGIGPDGLAALRRDLAAVSADVSAVQSIVAIAIEPASAEELGPALESALDDCLPSWRAEPAPEAPGSGRLASLRRRYHELGASNPFAAQEFAEIRDRLESLDAQRADLENAVRGTRELIANLNTLDRRAVPAHVRRARRCVRAALYPAVRRG